MNFAPDRIPAPLAELSDLVDLVRDLQAGALPQGAAKAAQRTLFNIVAVAVGATRTPGVQALSQHGAGGPVPATPGPRASTSTTPAHAALVTGFAAHYDDYDDTHLATVIHPAAATLGAVWALGQANRSSGEDLLKAVAIGCEVQLRLGNAVSPEHYDRGWHITGTCGVIGATVSAALLRNLDDLQLEAALAMSSTRVLGHREAFGTELKPFHAGQAAANAVRSATTAADRPLAGVHGLDRDPLDTLISALAPDTADPARLFPPEGTPWELEQNAIKPYPCGIVAHPGIDAGIAARDLLAREGVSIESIAHIDYTCHPLVPELMGRRGPTTELEARFSAVHGVAAALLHGRAGLAQFANQTVTDPVAAGLRDRIRFQPKDTIGRDAAVLTMHLADTRTLEVRVEHARGSIDRPLTDAELRDKASELLELGGGPSAAALWDWSSNLDADCDNPWRTYLDLEVAR